MVACFAAGCKYNQSINLYFRHWAHRTIKTYKNNTVKRQRQRERDRQTERRMQQYNHTITVKMSVVFSVSE